MSTIPKPPKFRIKIHKQTAAFIDEPPPALIRRIIEKLTGWKIELTKPGERA